MEGKGIDRGRDGKGKAGEGRKVKIGTGKDRGRGEKGKGREG